MILKQLNVFWGSRLVGGLELESGETRMTFTYAESWLTGEAVRPISLSLPLSGSPFRGGAAHWFFANLLPEGLLRQRLARRFGISADNDFALLSAIGGECAGALAVIAGDQPPQAEGYRPLIRSDLETLTTPGGDELVELLGSGQARLSLAGAQDKVPVLMVGDDLVLLPLGSAPSSHILKLPSATFRHLGANEVLCNMIARHCGLAVPEARLLRAGKNDACLVRRFDRLEGIDGTLERLHQEDLCQARGMPPTRKYEAEGGPTFAACFELVRDNSANPLSDARRLLRWQIFNLLCGNADGHAKNLGLLYSDTGQLILAPAYDLVCTRAYPALDCHLAMSIGGERDPGQVGRKHWEELAHELDLGRRYLLGLVKEMATQIPDHAQAAVAEFREHQGDSPALEQVVKQVHKQARRTLQLLRA